VAQTVNERQRKFEEANIALNKCVALLEMKLLQEEFEQSKKSKEVK